MRAAAIALLAALGGCLPLPAEQAGPPPISAAPDASALGAAVPAGHTGHSNESLAALFRRLVYGREWGDTVARLTRLDQPVVVIAQGPGSADHLAFLDTYTAYLARHTGIAIRRGTAGGRLHVRFVPAGEFTAALPGAACAQVPGDAEWDGEGLPDAGDPDAGDKAREATVFVPEGLAPADARRCLIEEIAQALGPKNDLYGLGPSIFNDDGGHVWPTRLDLLMLRVLYDPEMPAGVGGEAAERHARAILDRVNPAGRRAPALPPVAVTGSGDWRRLIERAVDRAEPDADRIAAARQAVAIAEIALPSTPWHCHGLTVLGHLTKLTEPEAALDRFATALGVCRAAHGDGDPRLATLRLARAGVLLSLARPEESLAATDGLAAVLAGHGHEAALAAHHTLRARALSALGRQAEARTEAAEAAAWSAYAFGAEGAAFSRLD